MNRASQKYYRLLYRQFALLEKGEKRFLNEFKKHLALYAKKHPNHQLQDYIDEFGEPEDIISAYYEHIDSKYVIMHMRSRTIIKYVSILLVSIVLILAGCLIYINYQTYLLHLDNDICYETTIIEEE